MPKRLSPPAVASLDAIDRAIVAALADDARIATSELARQIGLSAPATADRVRRLEAQGVIAGFTVELDPRALGYTLQAIVRVKPLPGQLHLVEELLQRIPEFVECDKVTATTASSAASICARSSTSTAFCRRSPSVRRRARRS